jgi:hypothetical protein
VAESAGPVFLLLLVAAGIVALAQQTLP